MGEHPRIEQLRRRVQNDPASIAFAALAEEYRRAGRFDDAIATCTAGLKRHPSYLSARVTLGRALIEVGRFEEAQEELEFVLRAAPENLAAIRGLADIHHRRGDAVPAPAHELSMPGPGDAAAPTHGSAPAAARPVSVNQVTSPASERNPVLDAQLRALDGLLGAIGRARTAAPRSR